MRVTTTARHCNIPDSLRQHAIELMTKMMRFDARASHGEVIFETEKHVRRVEGILSVDGSPPVIAKGEAQEFRPALDQMIDRLSRRLRKQRAQRTDHQALPLGEVDLPVPD